MMRTIALAYGAALGMMLTAGTAAAQSMQWWPAGGRISEVSGVSSTSPVRVSFDVGPDVIRKFALAGVEGWEKSDDACGLLFIARKLDPSAPGGSALGGFSRGDCPKMPGAKRAILPAGEFVNAIRACVNKTGNAAVLKGIRILGVRFDANGNSRLGTQVEYKRANCQADEWGASYSSCGPNRVATAVLVHTGTRGARGLSLECHTAYLLTAEPPKVTVTLGEAGFDTATGGKIAVIVALQNNFGETVGAAPSIKVDMRGNGSPGAGRCSGSPSNPRIVVGAGADVNNKQRVRIDFACSWADIATSAGCPSATTPYSPIQLCDAMLDLSVDGRVTSSGRARFLRGGNPLP